MKRSWREEKELLIGGRLRGVLRERNKAGELSSGPLQVSGAAWTVF